MKLVVMLGLVAVLGCGVGAVRLLSGTDADACYAGGEPGIEGMLTAGGDYGTLLDGKPVMWPKGWTGRWAGSEIEVHDGADRLVATTGSRYELRPGLLSDPAAQAEQARIGAVPVSPCDIHKV